MNDSDLTWTTVGADFPRGSVLKAIDSIAWRNPEGDWPMAPGLGIQECIRELRIPKVSLAGISEHLIQGRYSLYGIEGNYRNGRARVYVVDRGSSITPVASHLVAS